MRLSTVFELLLIFLFLALASSRHIDKKRLRKGATKQNTNPYCKCSDLQCNCCRDFPVVPIKGPGCASLGYKSGDVLRLTMSFGDRVLRNITLSGRRPKPVCMGLPGGISKFCGRLYNIERIDDHFKACLSLELRALDELEAALRVSCFNFGPKGVKLEPGEPLPSVATRPADEDDDDDDYDDIDDDDDDDDDEFDDDDDEYNDVDTDGDYTGFAALSDSLFEGFFFPTAESSGNKKKKPVRPAVQQQEALIDVTTKASAALINDTKEESTTAVPTGTVVTSGSSPSTTQRAETTQGPNKLVTVTTPKNVADADENLDSTEFVTDSPATESMVTPENEKTNETEESGSQEETVEIDNDKEDTSERDGEESNEGSAEEELDENENEEAAQAKIEDDDDDDEDDDDDDEEDDSEEDRDSAERESDHEEKEEDNILNVFFNHDEDSNESERERTRMEREKFKKILPGLMALLQPSPTPPTDDLSASFAYPAVRSARVHRRMRLPPI